MLNIKMDKEMFIKMIGDSAVKDNPMFEGLALTGIDADYSGVSLEFEKETPDDAEKPILTPSEG